jgi:hypothetical protein
LDGTFPPLPEDQIEPFSLLFGLVLDSVEISTAAMEGVEGVPTINGRPPRNSKFAGQTHPSGVPFKPNGFPDFSAYAEAEVEVEGLTGNTKKDSALANKAAGFERTPKGYTWHHVEDGVTMQLVPRGIHSSVGHTGGAAIIRNGGID